MPILGSRAAAAAKAFGQLVASSVASFARDALFSFDGLLLKGNVGDPTDTIKEVAPPSIKDYSSNNYALTIAGSPRASKFTPFATNYYSYYFNGSSSIDYALSTTGACAFGTGDFTIELWVYPIAAPTTSWNPFLTIGGSGGGIEIRISQNINGTGWGWLYPNNASSADVYAGYGTLTLGQWHHIAMVRSSSTMYLFKNGIQIATAASTTFNFTNTSLFRVGGSQSAYTDGQCNSYISNLRIVKGTGLYTSNFIPSTRPLTNVTGTTFLTANSQLFADSASNLVTTINSVPNVSQHNPFQIPSTYDFYGSQYFNGTTDYYTATPGSNLTMTGQFTIEFWFYLTSAGSTAATILSKNGSWSGGTFYIQASNGSNTRLQLWHISVNSSSAFLTSSIINTYTWYHGAVTRNASNVITLYLNGVSQGTYTTSVSVDYSSLTIGSNPSDGGATIAQLCFGGYISNIRIVSGSVLYTGNFTPSAVPLTNVSSTQLLTFQYNGSYNNNTIVDRSNYNAVVTKNGSFAAGTMSPYTGIYSLNINGSNWLYTPSNTILNFGTNDFTIEFWGYATSFGNGGLVGWSMWDGGSSTARFTVNLSQTGAATDTTSGMAFSPTQVTAVTPALNTWTHIALTRKGSDWRWYTNGINNQYVTSSATFSPSSNQTTIGNYQSSYATATGYICNLRVVNGTALYSGSGTFTPSAVPLGIVPNTVILMGTDGTFTDKARNLPISVSGTPSTVKLSPFAPSLYTQNQGNYSAFYGGSSDYHLLPTGTVLDFMHKNTADWTFECWFYGLSTSQATLVSTGAGAANVGFYLGINNTSTRDLNYQAYNGSAVVKNIYTATNAWALNQWNHIAVTFTQSSGLFSIYLNGSSQSVTTAGSSSYSSSTASFQPAIGRYQYSTPGGYFNGYISNMRIVNGTNLYPNGFSPASSPLPLVSGTALLTLQNTTVTDASLNGYTITSGGSPRTTAFGPFSSSPMTVTGGTITSPYTSAGSVMVFSTSDYGVVPHNTMYDFSTGGSWSVEAWIYTTGASTSYRSIIAKRNAASSWEIYIAQTTNYFGFYNGTQYLTSIPILNSIWYHVAACYDGTTLRLFVNGIQGYSGAVNAVTGTDNVYIGGAYYSSAMNESLIGYIADLRVIRGRAIYTSSFIPPSSSLPATSETVLLIKGDSGAIFDNAGCSNFQTVNSATASTAVSKFGTGSIKLSSATSDYLYLPANTIFNTGTNDWTLEAWVYLVSMPTVDTWPTGFASTMVIASTGTPSQADGTDCIIGATKLLLQINDTAYISPNTHGMVINTWYHLAYVRYNSTINFYVNGISIGQVAGLPTNGTGSGTYIGCETAQGAYFNGYIDDLRFSRVARYIAPYFALPTTSFSEAGPSVSDPGVSSSFPTVAGDGLTSATAGTSAAAIKAQTGTNIDGIYWINLPTVGPTQIYCIMNSAVSGGGWMMAMKATTGTTFNYSATHWNTVTTVNSTDYTRANADAKYHTMNYFPAKDIMALWPDITTNGGSLGTNPFGCWTWLETGFNGGSTTTLINFFNTAGTFNTGNVNTSGNYGGYFIKDAKTFSGWASGVFSSQPDIRFYGFNFKDYPNGSYDNGLSKVRWGFGWNENGEGLYTSYATLTNGGSASGSDDVSGGIGLDSNRGNYSAGDHNACCSDTTGINRSARVEIYIR